MNRHILVVLVALLACAAIATVAVAASPQDVVAPAVSPHRVCFPARAWDGEDGYRPCVRITAVEEDGSFSYSVGDAGGIDAEAVERYSGSVGALDR